MLIGASHREGWTYFRGVAEYAQTDSFLSLPTSTDFFSSKRLANLGSELGRNGWRGYGNPRWENRPKARVDSIAVLTFCKKFNSSNFYTSIRNNRRWNGPLAVPKRGGLRNISFCPNNNKDMLLLFNWVLFWQNQIFESRFLEFLIN